MKILHRYNDGKRQHFLLEKHYTFQLKPRLLYVGYLDKYGGWKEKPHSHDFIEIVFVVDGKVKIAADTKTYDAVKGDVIVYNAGVKHFEMSDTVDPAEIIFVAYDSLQITDLAPNCLIPDSYDILFHSGKMYDIFSTWFNMLLKEFEVKDKFYMEIAQNMSRTLVMYVFRLINRTKNISALLDTGKIIQSAVNYIEEHYNKDKISLDELANQCFTNKFYLSHIFSTIQGVSVGKYILNRKIEESKRLLSTTTLSIESIAEQCGFIDSSYFCRIFKKTVGITPSAYRKKSDTTTVDTSTT